MGSVRLRVSRVAVAVAVAFIAASAPVFAAVDRCLAVSSVPDLRPEHYAGPRMHPRVALKPSIIPVANTLAPSEARITFIGHSTFLIESADGVKIATDFNDYIKPSVLPDIVTMNKAHSTHYTDYPSPLIKHVLRGWNPAGGPARHDVEYKDVHVRNIATNTRWSDTGSYGAYGNSIFIFQLAGLCIGHLGHLHHTLTPEQMAAIGQLDIVLVPVDSGYTLDLPGMIEVLKGLRARLIIPMHYFNQFTLTRFLERVRGEWPVEIGDAASIVVSQKTLPAEAKIVVLPGQ